MLGSSSVAGKCRLLYRCIWLMAFFLLQRSHVPKSILQLVEKDMKDSSAATLDNSAASYSSSDKRKRKIDNSKEINKETTKKKSRKISELTADDEYSKTK